MTIEEMAALAAAACWAIAGLFAVAPIKAIGPIAFARMRMLVVVITLGGYLMLKGNFLQEFLSISSANILWLGLSGIIGIWLGDLMIFITMDRLGPRRTAVLFATNAPLQVVLGMLFLGESMSLHEILGCILVMVGAYCAIVFGKRASQVHQWEDIKGTLFIGVLFGLAAGVGQAVGALITKPVMEQGVTPQTATFIRCLFALVVSWLCLLTPIPNQKGTKPLTASLLIQIILDGTLAMTVGMSLLLYAMTNGDLGKVAIFSALTPVIMLPMIWIKTREVPAIGAWAGAGLAVFGIVLLSGNV